MEKHRIVAKIWWKNWRKRKRKDGKNEGKRARKRAQKTAEKLEEKRKGKTAKKQCAFSNWFYTVQQHFACRYRVSHFLAKIGRKKRRLRANSEDFENTKNEVTRRVTFFRIMAKYWNKFMVNRTRKTAEKLVEKGRKSTPKNVNKNMEKHRLKSSWLKQKTKNKNKNFTL